jgi:hypothetical protein
VQQLIRNLWVDTIGGELIFRNLHIYLVSRGVWQVMEVLPRP